VTDPPLDYAGSGVDLRAAGDAKERIRRLVESTFTEGVEGGFGGFGGMFRMPVSDRSVADGETILVASADGVGTKIKVAINADRHDTIGHDLVNHCVNDILVQGARPLFFLDYVAFGKLVPEVVERVVAGVAAGCRENGCALIGGETAEMPGMYSPPDYDLAGFIVGAVRRDRIRGSALVREGDVLVALASSGLHTNGYSLARRIVFEKMGLGVNDPFPGGSGTVAEVLLSVHRSYLRTLEPLLDRVHAMAHITGGGIPGNLDRILPPSLSARVNTASWVVPNLFDVLQKNGGTDTAGMFDAFNMGVGMIVVCDSADAAAVLKSADDTGIAAWLAGSVVSGDGKVILE
jgi:phosphoribosylformylglycinamidine cyclo-ligase